MESCIRVLSDVGKVPSQRGYSGTQMKFPLFTEPLVRKEAAKPDLVLLDFPASVFAKTAQ